MYSQSTLSLWHQFCTLTICATSSLPSQYSVSVAPVLYPHNLCHQSFTLTMSRLFRPLRSPLCHQSCNWKDISETQTQPVDGWSRGEGGIREGLKNVEERERERVTSAYLGQARLKLPSLSLRPFLTPSSLYRSCSSLSGLTRNRSPLFFSMHRNV